MLSFDTELMAVAIKDEAHRLIDSLPDDATWEDVMYRLYVREAVEQGLADSEAGRVTAVSDVRARLGLNRTERSEAARPSSGRTEHSITF